MSEQGRMFREQDRDWGKSKAEGSARAAPTWSIESTGALQETQED